MKKILLTFLSLGIVTSAFTQTILVEDFNYTPGDTLASVNPSKGWTEFNGGLTNYFKIDSTGLTYPGYIGSGIGKSISFTDIGQDAYKEMDSTIDSGSIYLSAMINVKEAQTSGDHIFGFLPPNSTSSLYSRVFIKHSSTGYYLVGISKTSVGSKEVATYSIDSFSYNTTYLAVLKYQFIAG